MIFLHLHLKSLLNEESMKDDESLYAKYAFYITAKFELCQIELATTRNSRKRAFRTDGRKFNSAWE